MNLLYTLTAYPPSTGGGQIHQHQLARLLNKRHNIQVVTHWDTNRTDWLYGTTIGAPSANKLYTVDGIHVFRMGFSWLDKLVMAPSTAAYYPFMMAGRPLLSPISACIGKHLESYAQKADLVHNLRIGREGLSYASYIAARRNSIPFVLTPVHHPRWVGRKYRAYFRLFSRADAVFALTHAEKEVLTEWGVKEERIHVIGHGPVLESRAEPEQFVKKYNLRGPTVLFLGQHYPYKGFRELL